MRQKPNANDAQMAVQLIGQRSFKANRTTNWLIAFAAIIVIILITSTCSVFFNIQAFSNLQDLKSIGTFLNRYLKFHQYHERKHLESAKRICCNGGNRSNQTASQATNCMGGLLVFCIDNDFVAYHWLRC